MLYQPSRYASAAEYRLRQRPYNLLSDAAVFSQNSFIPHQFSPLLPISRYDSNLSSWNLLDKIKNMCPWGDNDMLTNAKTVLYTPLCLPSPSEFLYPRPAPLPPNTVDRLPYDAKDSRLPFGQNIVNQPRAFDRSSVVPSIRRRKELFAHDEQTSKVSIARHSKRSRPPLSPRHNLHETRHREECVRKRVRFSTEVLPLYISGLNARRVPSHKTRLLEARKNRFLPFADWIAYHCNNILTEDNCSKLILTIIDEKLVAEKIASILEAYFPRRNSVAILEVSTATFLALWYLGRLFRRGIFSLSDVDVVGAPEAVIRVFLLGLTLADKWLNDGSRRIKDWSKFCRLPLHYRASAEKRALRMLDYNISITNIEWQDWLDRLEPSTSKFVSPNLTLSTQITAKVALDNLRRAKALQNIPVRGTIRSREVEISSESLSFLRLDLLED